MPHDHNHHTNISPEQVNRPFIIGIVLNVMFVCIEFCAGLYYNSLALLSDAGHNLSDVAGLALSLLAFKLAASRAPSNFTYGYHKSTIVASLANAVILLIAAGSIGWEAIHRFIHPVATEGGAVAVTAAVGIAINGVSAFFFFRNKNTDLNVKTAYLHLLSDALVSAGVVVAGIIISFTSITWIDPLISLLIMSIVIISTWSILKESLRLSLDAVPQNINMDRIKEVIIQRKGIVDIHHLHIWALSTTKNAMTAHLVLNDTLTEKEIVQLKSELRHELEHLNIQHATFETETKYCADEQTFCQD